MLAGFAYTLALTVVLSRNRVFWEDEMLGWMLLRDPSWHHMLRAYQQGADGGGFLFYLLGRGWLGLFGPSEISFRLFSSTCFGLAFAVTWAGLRRFYGWGLVAFALCNTWFFSPPFIAHLAEGRFYGLLVLGVSLAFWLSLVLAEVPEATAPQPTAPQPTPPRFYWLMFFIHALLTTSHLLGVVFSAFLLGALVVLDLLQHRPRPLLYLAGMAPWLLLLPERANIIASAQVGKPHFWTVAPRRIDILSDYTGSSKEIALVLAVLLVLGIFALLFSRTGALAPLRRAWAERRPVYVVTAALLLVPVLFFAHGKLGGTWLLNDRYMLPVTVAIAYVTAELARIALTPLLSLEVSRRTAWRWAFGLAVAAAFLPAMLFWDFHHLRDFSPSAHEYTAALTAKLPPGIPVVCEDAFTFTDLIGRQHASPVRYMYVLDWAQTISPAAPRVEVTQYHLMENWRKVGYFSGSIQPLDEFLQQNSRFFIIHGAPLIPDGLPPFIGNPLTIRFAHNPAYEVRPYTDLIHDGVRHTVSLVCRGSCGSPPARP